MIDQYISSKSVPLPRDSVTSQFQKPFDFWLADG
jgi:hypothetical protein